MQRDFPFSLARLKLDKGTVRLLVLVPITNLAALAVTFLNLRYSGGVELNPLFSPSLPVIVLVSWLPFAFLLLKISGSPPVGRIVLSFALGITSADLAHDLVNGAISNFLFPFFNDHTATFVSTVIPLTVAAFIPAWIGYLEIERLMQSKGV